MISLLVLIPQPPIALQALPSYKGKVEYNVYIEHIFAQHDIASLMSEENPLRYRWATYDGGHLDDQLWVLAMSTVRYFDDISKTVFFEKW